MTEKTFANFNTPEIQTLLYLTHTPHAHTCAHAHTHTHIHTHIVIYHLRKEKDRDRDRDRDRDSYRSSSAFVEKKDYHPNVKVEYVDDFGQMLVKDYVNHQVTKTRGTTMSESHITL